MQNPLRRLKGRLSGATARLQARQEPSGFQFAIADSVTFLPAEHWDAVTGGRRFFLRRTVLEATERHRPPNLSPRCALVYRDGRPVAAVAAQLLSLTGSNVLGETVGAAGARGLKAKAARTARRVAGALEQRALIAGNAMSWGFDGVAFAADEDPAPLWSGVAEALYRIRRADQLVGPADLVLVKDVTPAESHSSALHAFGYRQVGTEPNMVLELDPRWGNYDGYLAALDAKYRRNARDQARKLAEAGCVVEPVEDLGAYASELHRLYRAVQANAKVRLVTVPPTYLPALAEAAPDDVACHMVRRGDDVVGFISVIRDGTTAIGYFIGFDREIAAAGVPIYLRLLHATIGIALDWGCTRLSLGRTALEPKAAMGAKPEPMSVWIRHRNPALNRLVRGLIEVVPPPAEAPERNPFKKSAA